jgi:hypothetical protein
MRETARAVGTTNDVEGSTAPFPEIRLRGAGIFGGNTKFKGQRSMKAKCGAYSTPTGMASSSYSSHSITLLYHKPNSSTLAIALLTVGTQTKDGERNRRNASRS